MLSVKRFTSVAISRPTIQTSPAADAPACAQDRAVSSLYVSDSCGLPTYLPVCIVGSLESILEEISVNLDFLEIRLLFGVVLQAVVTVLQKRDLMRRAQAVSTVQLASRIP